MEGRYQVLKLISAHRGRKRDTPPSNGKHHFPRRSLPQGTCPTVSSKRTQTCSPSRVPSWDASYCFTQEKLSCNHPSPISSLTSVKRQKKDSQISKITLPGRWTAKHSTHLCLVCLGHPPPPTHTHSQPAPLYLWLVFSLGPHGVDTQATVHLCFCTAISIWFPGKEHSSFQSHSKDPGCHLSWGQCRRTLRCLPPSVCLVSRVYGSWYLLSLSLPLVWQFS